MEEAAGQRPASGRPKSQRSPRELAQARQRAKESCEYQLWQSCGRQISSTRRTIACSAAFGRPRVVPQSRALEPPLRSPGPIYALPGLQEVSPSMVIKDFGDSPRFPKVESFNANASPFSTVYPYQEPPPAPAPSVGEPSSPATEVSSPRGSGQLQQPRQRSRRAPGTPRQTWEDQERQRRRQAPQQQADLNALCFRYPAQPAYSFASKQNRRAQLFRDLRGSVALEGRPHQGADFAKPSA